MFQYSVVHNSQVYSYMYLKVKNNYMLKQWSNFFNIRQKQILGLLSGAFSSRHFAYKAINEQWNEILKTSSPLLSSYLLKIKLKLSITPLNLFQKVAL